MTATPWAKDHPAVFVAALAIFLCATTEIVLLLRLHSLRADAATHRERLSAIESLAKSYRELRGKQGALKIAPGNVLTPGAVTRIAQKRGIAGSLSVTGAPVIPSPRSRTREQVVSFLLSGVTRKDLAEFLRDIEQLDPAVWTKELRITANSRQPSLQDAKVQVSAYESTATASR